MEKKECNGNCWEARGSDWINCGSKSVMQTYKLLSQAKMRHQTVKSARAATHHHCTHRHIIKSHNFAVSRNGNLGTSKFSCFFLSLSLTYSHSLAFIRSHFRIECRNCVCICVASINQLLLSHVAFSLECQWFIRDTFFSISLSRCIHFICLAVAVSLHKPLFPNSIQF